MSKPRKKKPTKQRTAKPRGVVEDRRAETVTVAWMLTLLATIAAEILGFVAALFVWQIDVVGPWEILPGLLWFVALVTGALCLLMMPLVYRFRREPPPTPIAALSLTAGLIPLVLGIVRSMT